MTTENWLEIGKIIAPQGLKGEVRVYPDSDFPERFEQPGPRWLLHPGDAQPRAIKLLSGRVIAGKGLYVLRFEGISDRAQAEALRGCRLMVQKGDRPQLEEGEFHVMDLVGLHVFDQATQVLVGVVVDVLSAGNDLLEVKRTAPSLEHVAADDSPPAAPGPNILIPFVEAIVPVVDLEQGRIEITPPAGLVD